MSQLPKLINVYCDESCHLQSTEINVMAFGAIYCSQNKIQKITNKIREIKIQHKLEKNLEIKWSKISPSTHDFYIALVKYFFSEPNLHYRTVVVPDKSKLNHQKYEQTHDDFYYKMYFIMLRHIINPDKIYHFYLDIKDSHGGSKTCKLQEYLANSIYDFNKECVGKVQQIRSHESELLQLCDLFTGAMTYANRHLTNNKGKISVINEIKSNLPRPDLTCSSLFHYNKFNVLIWKPSS